MTRRVFSSLLIAASAGSAFSGPVAQAQTSTPQRFSVMLWALGKGLTMEQRLDMVAAAGYNGGELVTEWRTWSEDEKQRVVAKKKALGLAIDVMFPGTAPLTDPNAREKMLAEIKEALPVARELQCPQFSFKAGPRIPGKTPEQLKQTIADSLKAAAVACEGSGMELLLEPIDLLEDKRETVNSVTDAFEIVRAVNHPRVKVLYDFYHEQRGSGNLIEKLEKNIDLVGLVHIADVPGRHHPGTGEIDYSNIYRALAKLRYSRYITMEFVPQGDAIAELKAARAEALAAMRSA